MLKGDGGKKRRVCLISDIPRIDKSGRGVLVVVL